ncbi:MAG TPA: helix-turn-helix domain-containing protein [Pseudonocardiaceae bacterium]|nr:helix-turn-helix domain-containing protein [Pseudonocardiaceae bacterium]
MTSEAIQAVATLADELRGGMYRFIRAAGRPVTRDEAAAAVGISRKLAAFHLDKLVAAGLLRAWYEPMGVGRAPKVYEPSGRDIDVCIPARRPDLLAEILLQAVLTEAGGETARGAALRLAADRGRRLGAAALERHRPGRLGAERALTLAGNLLAEHGFEPDRPTPDSVRLRVCPFHPLAGDAPELVCGLLREFLAGVLDGLRVRTASAEFAAAGGCCVQLRATGSDRTPSPTS